MEIINDETLESIERNNKRISEWFAHAGITYDSKQTGCINLNLIDYVKIAEVLRIAPESTKTK